MTLHVLALFWGHDSLCAMLVAAKHPGLLHMTCRTPIEETPVVGYGGGRCYRTPART